MTIARQVRLLEATMPEVWATATPSWDKGGNYVQPIDTSTLGAIRLDMRPTTLEQLLCTAEIAKAALNHAAADTTKGWQDRYKRAENASITAETELCGHLTRVGFDVDRIVSVLS